MLGKLMNTINIESNSRIASQKVKDFERELKAELPKDYFDFLVRYNGGKPSADTFEYKLRDGRSWTGGVQDFLGFDVENWKNIIFFSHMRGDRVPENMIPIANDEGGNFVLLTISGQDKGKVLFWDHDEESEDDEPPTNDNLYFIANSFTEFLEKLHADTVV